MEIENIEWASKQQIEELLSEVVATPIVENNLTDQQKIDTIEVHIHKIMETLGLDLSDDSLIETPRRVAKMWVKELFSGLNIKNFPKITAIENKMKYDQMIVVQNIQVLSCCEHHFQTIEGVATIAYIPKDRVIGLSKLNRIAQFFARRPQVQERFTKQVADCLQKILDSDHVAVHINAKHYCVIARGIEDSQSTTITSDLRGDFKSNPETRKEFLGHCRQQFQKT